jgi:superfamily II DNA or RNA helicase
MVLTNYALIVEGFDVPDCECCIIARPTQSLVIHIQSTMRCMRYKPNKRAIILDFVGNYERHGLPDDEREWSLERIKQPRIKKDEEPKVLIRNCPNCFKVYSASLGTICPYCQFNVGKTKEEIEYDEKQELIKLEAYERKTKRMEVGMCKTKADLERVAKERGYARGWVYNMMKIKNIRS